MRSIVVLMAVAGPMATTIAGASSLSPAASDAMKPSGPWKVDHNDSGCVLSRSYGVGASAVTLAFKPNWLGVLNEVTVLSRDRGDASARAGKARVTLNDTDVLELNDDSVGVSGGQRLTRIYVPDTTSFRPDVATGLTVVLDKKETLRLALPAAKAAFAALDGCQDKVMDGWEIFPWERRPKPKPAVTYSPATGDAGDWITNDDYPATSVRAREEGTVKILWTIGTDGRVKDCKPIESSFYSALDNAACDAVVRHGRYAPATDAQGRPIETHALRVVIWRLQ